MRMPCRNVGTALLLLSVALGTTSKQAGAQAASQPIYESTQGTLASVNPRINAVIMKAQDGKNHAWKLGDAVIKEAARYKTGDKMWVIYRSVGFSERAVTALGFPGSNAKPLYVNATGGSVLLRTGPYTEGSCRAVPAEKMTSQTLPPGSEFVDEAACWCCATAGEQCDLANRSHDLEGTGRIVLSRCYP